MESYKVIALSVGGSGNKIHNSGDIVKADGFIQENIQALIDGKYIELVEKEKKEEVTKKK